MDLRKGSGVPEGKRRCIRCHGRKKLYKAMGGWCFDNSGGELKDCPLCLGAGVIDVIPPEDITLVCQMADLEEKDYEQKEKRPRKKSKKESEKEY